jgi:hypothetical protein
MPVETDDFDFDDLFPEDTAPEDTAPEELSLAVETFDFNPGDFYQPPKPIIENIVPTKSPSRKDWLPFEAIENPQRTALRIARQLLQSGPFSFNDLDDALLTAHFPGLYAVYYQGTLQVYMPLRSLGSTCPMYIGKSALNLFSRLRIHKSTIEQVGLGLENFTFRFLHLPFPGEAEFAESSLIKILYSPLWNEYLRGFGNDPNDEVNNRKYQSVSLFDTYHPGRHHDVRPNTRPLADIETLLEKAVPACRQYYDRVTEQIAQLDDLLPTSAATRRS